VSQAGNAEIIERYTPKPPKQVQDGIAAADALRAQMSGEQPPPVSPPNPPAPGAPPVQPAAAPPASVPSPTPAAPSPFEDDQTWEQRARSAQGRYDNQVAVNRALNERLVELERAVATNAARGTAEPANPTPPAAPKLVTDQERADFGEDFLNVVGKRAKEEYFPEFDMLAQRLKRLEGRVDGTVQLVTKGAQQDVYAQLDATVPAWRTINRHQQFKDWLEHIDPFSGRKRNDMLQEAFARQDGNRVVNFFRGFAEAAGLPQSQPNPSPTPSTPAQPGNGTTGGALTLEQLAAPGRARSAPEGSHLPPEKPMYTHAWIAQFMADKRTGKYRGREADADLIERDIYQAQHEGRIHAR